MTMDHRITPFFDALRAYAKAGIVPFHTPGHKQGRGAHPEWLRAIGAAPLQLDVSDVVVSDEYDDNWFKALAAAEALTADALGADECLYLANGTTGGIHALLVAAASNVGPSDRAGQRVIIARHSHRSVIGGLILADAEPVYVESVYDADRHVWMPPPPAAWHRALLNHPDAAALLVTYPTYEGIAPDLEAIVAGATEFGVPVLVDEAHGPHFGLHPRLPRRALDVGAEWSAQSTHKLLGSLTQASWLVGKPNRVSAHAVSTAHGLLQTTSPSALIFASLDVARQQVALHGKDMMDRALTAADEIRSFVDRLGGVRNVRFEPPFWDATKLLIDVSALDFTGYAAAEWLRQRGIQVEMATSRHVLALATFGDTKATVAALCEGLERLVIGSDEHGGADGGSRRIAAAGFSEHRLPPLPRQRMRPRHAALGPSHIVPLAAATGEISSDIVCPYPPGIPVLCPGEEVSSETVSYLQDILHSGGEVRGVIGHPDEPHVRVVADGRSK